MSRADTPGEPVVTAGGANLPPLLVRVHGDPIEPGKVYAKAMAEATVDVMEGKAEIVGVGEHGKFGLVKKASK
jgi:hypothetical protein